MMKFAIANYVCKHVQKKSHDSSAFKSLNLLQRLDRTLYEQSFTKILSHHIDALKNRLATAGPSGLDSLVCSKLKLAVDFGLKMADLQLHACKLLLAGSADKQTEEYKNYVARRDFQSELKFLQRSINIIYDSNVSRKWDLETLTQTSQIVEKKKICSSLLLDKFSTIYIAYNEGLIKIWKRESDDTLFITKDTNFRKYQQITTAPGLRCICVSSDAKRLIASVESRIIVYVIDGKIGVKKPLYNQSLILTGHSDGITSLFIYNRYIISGSLDKSVKLWTGTTAKPEAMRSASFNAAINCMCFVNLFSYIKNAEVTVTCKI